MRSYEVARREARGEGVPFQVGYWVDVPGAPGEPVAAEHRTEVFTAYGSVSSITLSEFSRNANMESTDPAAMALLAEFFVEAFGDEPEYRRFMQFRHQHRLEDDQVMEIVGGLMEDLVGRPTGQPAPSQAARSTSGPGSRVDSLQPAELEQTVSGVVVDPRRAFTVVEGLEDLAAPAEARAAS